MNCKFLHIPYTFHIKQPDTRQRNGIKISETEIFQVKVALIR